MTVHSCGEDHRVDGCNDQNQIDRQHDGTYSPLEEDHKPVLGEKKRCLLPRHLRS